MRIASAVTAMIAIASHAALADIKRHASIPQALQGSWAPSAQGCESDEKSVIVLTAKAYTSAEMTCAVDWVSETAAPRGSTYSAHLRCIGQAPQAASSVVNLIIRPDGAKQISVGLDFSNLRPYQRCAAKE